MSAKVLVIGGAGYIGSHVVLDLADRGCEVVVLDDLSSGFRELVGAGEFIQGSLDDEKLLGEIFSSRGVDVVMHFAAYSKVEESVENPLAYWRNNVAGPVALLQSMAEHGVENFIFSSSAAVYGDPAETPVTEDAPLRPINPYGATKAAMERILSDLDVAGDVRSVSLRYFNAAGADPKGRVGDLRPNKTHIIPIVLEAANGQREEVRIFGADYPTPDGTCIRDYIHVSDLSRAHLMAMDHLLEGGGGQVFNLGNGRGHSVREVVECARRVTGRRIGTVEVDRRPGDPAKLVASSARIMERFGWRPEYGDLDCIIETAWAWHLKNSSTGRIAEKGGA
jgi:UDP-glucose 4-epimerase